MLPSQRLRERTFTQRAASGENVWTETIPAEALVRLDAAWEIAEEDQPPRWGDSHAQLLAQALALHAGTYTAGGIYPGHFRRYLGPSEQLAILDLLQLIAQSVPGFSEMANDIFYQHRIGFIFVDDELVPRSSDELDQAAVHEALRLTVGTNFSAAHESYLEALKRLSRGDAANAITSAGTAFQEALIAAGAKGNNIGTLVSDARKRSILAGHDGNLTAGIEKFAMWVGADRSETGDAHKKTDASRDDAWLMIHVVGALIVRLASPSGTRQP